jgi:replicative superfamily II helicase
MGLELIKDDKIATFGWQEDLYEQTRSNIFDRYRYKIIFSFMPTGTGKTRIIKLMAAINHKYEENDKPFRVF